MQAQYASVHAERFFCVVCRHLFSTSGVAVAVAPRKGACMYCGADCCDISSEPCLTNFKKIQREAQARVVEEHGVEVDLQPVRRTLRVHLCQQGHFWASWSCFDMNEVGEEDDDEDYSDDSEFECGCESPDDPIDGCNCNCHFEY